MGGHDATPVSVIRNCAPILHGGHLASGGHEKVKDIVTVIMSIVVLPVLYFLLRKITRFLQRNLGKALDAVLWGLGPSFNGRWLVG